MYFSQNIKPNKVQIYIIIFLYSVLPISYISGSFLINLNFLLIDLFFIFAIFKYKNFKFSDVKIEIYFITAIFLYILINSIVQYIIYNNQISLRDEGFIRSIGLIKYVLFYFASIYFFQILNNLKINIFNFWSVITFIVIFDVFYERVMGHNILNIKSSSTERISSFFGDELIVGYFILAFGFISIINVLPKVNLKNKALSQIILNFLILLIPFTIFITGERSNFLKSIFICFTLLLFFSKYKQGLNIKYFFVLSTISLLVAFISSDNLRTRYLTTFKEINKSFKEENKIFVNSKHYYNYKLGYEIFKENIFFGVSTKKFRSECKTKENLSEKMKSFGCSTHPHQTYIDLLSEHGIFGFLLIFISFLLFILKRTKIFFETKNYILLSSIVFIISIWIPFLPSGSFFSTSFFSLIMINLIVARTSSI